MIILANDDLFWQCVGLYLYVIFNSMLSIRRAFVDKSCG